MRVGTVGTGWIVEQFLNAIADNDEVKCDAVYSRKEETGYKLASKFGVEKVYTELSDMLEDDNLNFIYIASPNSLHFYQAKLALESGKNVICEKPFTSNKEELQILMKIAKDKNLYLFEGITTIYLPNYKLIKKDIEKLGKIKMIQCNYSQYSSKYNAFLAGELPNVFNPVFSGGALVDINIYNINFVMNHFGLPNTITYDANKHENGIDTSGVVVLGYSGFKAVCVGCKDTRSVNHAIIQGEKGYIYVNEGSNGCRSYIIKTDNVEELVNEQDCDNNLYYEMQEISKIYRNRDYDKCLKNLEYSYNVQTVLDEARKSAGIAFSSD